MSNRGIYRLRRSSRLTGPGTFQAVFDEACVIHSRTIQAYARSNGRAPARLGLVVGKRMDRRAVRRNAVKRRLREAFRHHQGQLIGLDVVLRAKSGLQLDQLRTDLPILFQRLARLAREQLPPQGDAGSS